MIAKGLDFPQVRLVAVISADTALGIPDFRAAERAFCLLTQVAGRTGRSDWGGEVILQTYNPDHPAIQFARYHDYAGFYGWDIENRRSLRYPPYTHFVNMLFSGEEERAVCETATETGQQVRCVAPGLGLDVLGPAPCAISRLRNRYRWHMLVRGPRVQEIVRLLRSHVEARNSDRCQVSLDVDPVQLL
jgi:primosomal protein N' (replication factor Y)